MPHRESISLDEGYVPDVPDLPYVDHDGSESNEDPGPPPALARRVPANAPRPQDHLKPRKAKKPKRRDRPRSAVEREGRGIETVAVEYDGDTYVIAADVLDWGLETTIAFEEGRAVTAIRSLLGPKQSRALMAKGYTNRQFQALFDLLAKAGGFETSGN